MAHADEQTNFTSAAKHDQDNISIATMTATNLFISLLREICEYIVKFLFCPKNNSNNTHVAKTHYLFLCSTASINPEAQIFDNFGCTMHEFPALNSYNAYLRHFKLQFIRSNEQKNWPAIYLAFHQFCSSIPIGEIRSHSSITTLLQQVNTRMMVHHWNEDETQIANLGFHVGIDPSNCPKTLIEAQICTWIALTTGQNAKTISTFCFGYTLPFLLDKDGVCTATKAYNLQCHKKRRKSTYLLASPDLQHLSNVFVPQIAPFHWHAASNHPPPSN